MSHRPRFELTLTLTSTSDLDLQPVRATVMTHAHPQNQGQRSRGSKIRMKTDGRTYRTTEAFASPPVLTRSVTISESCATTIQPVSHDTNSIARLSNQNVFRMLNPKFSHYAKYLQDGRALLLPTHRHDSTTRKAPVCIYSWSIYNR